MVSVKRKKGMKSHVKRKANEVRVKLTTPLWEGGSEPNSNLQGVSYTGKIQIIEIRHLFIFSNRITIRRFL